MSEAHGLTFRTLQDKLMALTRKVDRLEQRSPSLLWRTYTPALTATTVNPNIGTTGSALGRYTRNGDTVTTWGSITFGGAGIAAGNGTYRISVPFPRTSASAGTNIVLGSCAVFNGAASWGFFTAVIIAAGNSYFEVYYPATWPTGALTAITQAAPWAWNTAGMLLVWSVQYEASPY